MKQQLDHKDYIRQIRSNQVSRNDNYKTEASPTGGCWNDSDDEQITTKGRSLVQEINYNDTK